MNTWNIKKAKKIIKIVYEYQKKEEGIGFRELVRQSGLSKRGLEIWLTHLREEIWLNGSGKISIVRKEPRIPILLTEEALESYEKDTLILRDPRSKNKLTDRDRKTILLILSITAFGYFKWKKVYQDQSLPSNSITKSYKNKEFIYLGGKCIPGVAINDLVSNLKNKVRMHKLRAHLLENQINVTNIGLFGFLDLTKDEAKKSIEFLTHDCYILRENKYHNQKRYTIRDKELEGFIKTCIILYCQDVYPILEYFSNLNESRLRDREKREIEHFDKYPSSYPNTSKEERLSEVNQYIKSLKSSSAYDYRLKRSPTFNNRGQQPDQIKNFQKWMRETWFGKDKTSVYSDFIKRGLLPDVDRELERAVRDIYKCSIFDDEFNGINDKYKTLEVKYPEIIGAILDILFPEFFKDIIREYKKNVTTESNLLNR